MMKSGKRDEHTTSARGGEGKRKQIVGGAGEEVEGSHGGGGGEGVEDVQKEVGGVVDDTYIHPRQL